MLLFLIGFSIWVPIRQGKEIVKFTKEEPIPVEVEDIPSREIDVRNLVERLEVFRSDLSDNETEAEIALSADDINLAIAHFDALKELRGTFRVTSISDEALNVDICYQLNGPPRLAKDGEDGPITSDPRYLVAKMKATPQLGSRELALRVDGLDADGADIPDGFMGHFSTLRIFDQTRTELPEDNELIANVMAQLTKAQIDGDKLVLARIPGDPIPDVVTDDQFLGSGGKIAKFLGAAMIGFLVLAGIMLFLGYRTQMRKLRSEEEIKDLPPGV